MDILITGGAGFIGSHLAEKLLEAGHRVQVLDNLSTGRLENVSHLQDHDAFELVVGSIMEQDVVTELVSGAEQVYHLAAAVGVERIIDNPLDSIEVNVRGTENVLWAANPDKTPVFLASTSEIYGKNKQIPFTETQDRVLGSTTISRWSYSCTKALDEFLALAFYRQKRLPVVIGRLFNTVGPRQTGQYGMVIPRFVNQALLEHPITIHGDGKQTRSFMDVDDTTNAIVKLMANPDLYGDVYNIGSEERVSIRSLAERVIESVDSRSELRFIPYDEVYGEGFEDMRHRIPDTSKLRRAIDFQPRHDLETILERVIDYFRSNEGFV